MRVFLNAQRGQLAGAHETVSHSADDLSSDLVDLMNCCLCSLSGQPRREALAGVRTKAGAGSQVLVSSRPSAAPTWMNSSQFFQLLR